MDFKDIVQNVIALLAVVISAAALIRTRRFEAKQIEFQHTADRLNRLQATILEREENARVLREQEAEAAAAEENRRKTEAAKQRHEEIIQGDLTLQWGGVRYGEERLTLKNSGAVPVRDVGLSLRPRDGVLPQQLLEDLRERFPIPVLETWQEIHLRTGARDPSGLVYSARIEWSTDWGSFYREVGENNAHSTVHPRLTGTNIGDKPSNINN